MISTFTSLHLTSPPHFTSPHLTLTTPRLMEAWLLRVSLSISRREPGQGSSANELVFCGKREIRNALLSNHHFNQRLCA